MEQTAITKDTRLCISLSGRPSNIGTRFHNHLYAELGLNYVYKAFTTTDIAAAVGGIRALGIRGAGISMPFKEAVIPMMDAMHDSAANIQSVNTIVNDDGALRAYNTDYVAVATLLDHYDVDPSRQCVVAGAGGMAKAVVAVLRNRGHRDVTVLARNERTGPALAEQYDFTWTSNLDDHAAEAAPTLLVNATPLGMAGAPTSEDQPFDAAQIEAADVVFDVVAVPSETPLIRAARAAGKTVITGGEVVTLQALEQFVLYTGVRPDEDQVRRAAEFSQAPSRT